MGVGFFAVAVGLVLGSLFDRQQDTMGWMMVLLVILIGAMSVEMTDLTLPASVQAIVAWIPSAAPAKVYGCAFLEHCSWGEICALKGKVVGISLLLYGVVVWKVRRSDR